MKHLVISILLLATTSSLTVADPVRLVPGVRMEQTAEGGDLATFEMTLAADRPALLRVEQRGVDVKLRLLRNGELVAERDGLNSAWGVEILVLEGDPAWILEIDASSDDGGPASYLLELDDFNPGSDEANVWRLADQAMTAALEGVAQQTRQAMPRAVTDFRRAERAWRKLDEPELRAEAFFGQGIAHRRLGQDDEALRAFKNARTLFESVELPPGTARSWNQIGLVQASSGQVMGAIRSLERALEGWRELGSAAMQGAVLSNLGNCYQDMGELRRALEHYEKALRWIRSTAGRHNEATALNNIGAVYAKLGEPDQAHARYREALAGARQSKSRTLEAGILVNLGYLHRITGEMQEALQSYQGAIRIYEELEDPRSRSTALNNLGVLHHVLGQSERGARVLEEALELRRRIGYRRGEAITLTRLGSVRTWQGRLGEARDVLHQALRLRLQDPNDPAGEASTRATLGAVYTELGQSGPAMEQLNRALALVRDPERPHPRREILVLWQIGNLKMLEGKLDAADHAYRQSLALSRRLSSADGAVQALRELGRVEAGRGRLDAARGYLGQALEIIERRRVKVVDPVLRARFHGRQHDTHELYLRLLLRLARERGDPAFEGLALEANERARARGLIELLSEAESTILRGADPESAARRRSLARRLNAKAARAAGLTPSTPAKARELALLEEEIEDLLEDKRAVEAKVRGADPRYMDLLELPEVDTRKIRESLLDENTLLLEYALGTERGYLWVLSRESLHTFVLPPRDVVEETARRGYARLSRRRAGSASTDCEAMVSLGKMLLDPARGLLGERRLVIVPDGVLHYLPFAALADPRDPEGACGRPLVERHEITQAPSAAAVLEQRARLGARAAAPRRLAILADPVFRADDPRVRRAPGTRSPGEPASGFERLPWSRREAEAISEVARAAFSGTATAVLQALDFAAGREALARLGDYRVVHFATHGILDSDRPELSGLVLSLVDAAGHPRSDGYLRLHDLYDLELRADLVVLSGCRTALGQAIRGEGLVGLTHGFFYAGAARVMASLWQVDDRATAELMRRFYQELLRGAASPPAALRAAQISLRGESRWRDPYFWAAFIVQGE